MNDLPRYYFDWAATAIPAEVKSSAEKNHYGNPSSTHLEGRLAKETLENARARCAKVLGVKPETLYFSSGGTESNALVLYSLLLRKGKGRLLYSGIEHPSVRENCRKLKRLWILTGESGIEKDGRLTEDSMSRSLNKYPDARFIAMMGVNN
jgi:cysteine desulfurase